MDGQSQLVHIVISYVNIINNIIKLAVRDNGTVSAPVTYWKNV